eukprot:TRINITY_DN39289_c0_g1_i1.p1 TRINITY_DN39289_c0_g1~~TRINITY_DN39289_c0_g1_i1.p1  ORF type:complete len:158 (+),score=7.46 TRINITY_DN39289_c0_g1_i1:58-531(+)
MSSYLHQAQKCGFKGSVPAPTGEVDDEKVPGWKERTERQQRILQGHDQVRRKDAMEHDHEESRQKDLALKRQRQVQLQMEEAEVAEAAAQQQLAEEMKEEQRSRSQVEALSSKYGESFLWTDRPPAVDRAGRRTHSRGAINAALQRQLVASPVSVTS